MWFAVWLVGGWLLGIVVVVANRCHPLVAFLWGTCESTKLPLISLILFCSSIEHDHLSDSSGAHSPLLHNCYANRLHIYYEQRARISSQSSRLRWHVYFHVRVCKRKIARFFSLRWQKKGELRWKKKHPILRAKKNTEKYRGDCNYSVKTFKTKASSNIAMILQKQMKTPTESILMSKWLRTNPFNGYRCSKYLLDNY